MDVDHESRCVCSCCNRWRALTRLEAKLAFLLTAGDREGLARESEGARGLEDIFADAAHERRVALQDFDVNADAFYGVLERAVEERFYAGSDDGEAGDVTQ